LVGRWKAEKIYPDKSRLLVLVNNADGAFELDERITRRDRAPETIVYKGKWSAENGDLPRDFRTTHKWRTAPWLVES